MEEEDDDFYAHNGDAHIKSEGSAVKAEHTNGDATMQDDVDLSERADEDGEDEEDEDEDEDDSVGLSGSIKPV